MENEQWKLLLDEFLIEWHRCVSKLDIIWDKIGYDEQTKAEYRQQAKNHLKDLAADMLKEFENREDALFKSMDKYMKEIYQLSKELGLDPSVDKAIQKGSNLPLCQAEKELQERVEALKEEREVKVQYFKELLKKESDVCKCLGVEPLRLAPTELPTQEELENFQLYIDQQEEEKNKRARTFNDMRQSVIKIMNDLGLLPSNEFEDKIYSNFDDIILSIHNLDKLKILLKTLNDQMEEAKQCADNMRQELKVLWSNLEEPEEMLQIFLNNYSDYSRVTLTALNAELIRCKEKRRENISKYIRKIREELMKLWELCKLSEDQRKEFAPFQSCAFTDDLLNKHELERERLQKYYNNNRAIFDLLDERDTLCLKMKELEQRANDPDRFHNRGGQLLAEEKERKIINKKLPKIEDELRKLIQHYEIENGEPFLIKGQEFDEFLQDYWDAYNLERENMKKARKETREKSVKKPPMSASRRTPGQSTASRITPCSSKRKLVDPSTSQTRKRRNLSSESKGPALLINSRSRRSKGASRRIFNTPNKTNKTKSDKSCSNSEHETTATYGEFQEHFEDRNELRSTLIHTEVLRTSTKQNMRTPRKTPLKPTRKNVTPVLSYNTTPKTIFSVPRTPRSPKLATPRLAAAPCAHTLNF
ncbi:protein regulator of cytokinesis 1-like [Prorops nasuta]|uniref:protein regulator of cytokinesis 1-like n=1 Tax=Prorops nasuta TaxID=863751 RepID=UPI0034CF8683